MAVSVFDLFTIGIGPSSSHTVGPMRAARQFAQALDASGGLDRVRGVRVHLYGSLAATGRGHGTDRALLLGLEGETPEAVDIDRLPARVAAITDARRLRLLGRHEIAFDRATDLAFERGGELPGHPNGMRFVARGDADRGGTGDVDAAVLDERVYYSVGGGFVAGADEAGRPILVERDARLALPFATAGELLARCEHHDLPISGVMLRNERAWGSESGVRAGLLEIWGAMQQCVLRGCRQEGELPGLHVPRRAPGLHRQLAVQPEASLRDPLSAMDWVSLYALAVNEENAAGGRVVTAPTNGASRLALRGSGRHVVSLDKVIRTMRDTGRDMQEKYKETSRGGLATHVIQVAVNVTEC